MKYAEIVAHIPTYTGTQDNQQRGKSEIHIEFPVHGGRARKVTSRSKTIPTSKYPSWKMGRTIHCESPHESTAVKLLEACADVTYFQEQPCRITYVLHGERQTHFPDVLVCTPSGKELVEIKRPVDAARKEVIERTAFMQHALRSLGYGYRLVTSDHLEQQPRLENVETLLRFGRSPISVLKREQVRQLFNANGSMPWGSFHSGTYSSYRAAICRLVLEGVLEIDFNQSLGNESPINWATPPVGRASWE